MLSPARVLSPEVILIHVRGGENRARKKKRKLQPLRWEEPYGSSSVLHGPVSPSGCSGHHDGRRGFRRPGGGGREASVPVRHRRVQLCPDGRQLRDQQIGRASCRERV